MRLLVFFDLPVQTANDRKNYRIFRKFLIKEGYLMLQESVYSKLCINEHAVQNDIARLQKNRPPHGLVQALRVAERQYAKMLYITGEPVELDEVSSLDELVIL